MTETSNRVVATLEKNSRESVVVALSTFNGHDLIDIRIFVDGDDGPLPTRKGVSLRIGQLPELIRALNDAAEMLASDQVRAA